MSGIYEGAFSATIMLMYLFFYFSNPGSLGHFTTLNIHRLAAWLITVPVTTVLVSILKYHNQQLTYEQAVMHKADRYIQALRDSEEHYRLVVENLHDYAICTLKKNGIIASWNSSAERLLGYEEEQIIGKHFSVLFQEKERLLSLPEQLLEKAAKLGKVEEEGWRRCSDGFSFFSSGSITALYNEKGVLRGFINVMRDMTERRAAEEQIQHQAFHDALTNLPNRALLNERLTQTLQVAKKTGEMVAIMFLDLDRFKTINDTLGHQTGDAILKEVAFRLQNCISDQESVARFGGDEFLIMLTNVKNTEDVARVVKKVFKTLKPAIVINNQHIYINTSIGIAIYPRDGEQAETLLKNADNALYQAKDAGRNSYQIYSRVMHTKASAKLLLENDLRKALENNEFVIYYQPIKRLNDGALFRAEALVRWQHPRLGLILPGEFITLAEETGIIQPLGEWVFKTVTNQLATWHSGGIKLPIVSVNLSARQFLHPDLYKKIENQLKKSLIDPAFIQLEITESITMNDIKATVPKLLQLKKMGMSIAIDDFGTGYSSLSYLKKLPIDRLKIDKSFVQNCTTDPQDAAIVQAIVSMAHTLNLDVCAEGVELPEQWQFLKEIGCDCAQGYLVGFPIPTEEFSRLLVSNLH